MDKAAFVQLLEELDDKAWSRVVDGQAILLVDDMRLETGADQSANAIIRAAQNGTDTAATLKQRSLHDAAGLLHNYYLTHPLTLTGFNLQVKALLARYGAEAFAAPIGQLPRYTLFVEGGEVMAEASDSPRFRYGAFCELGHSVPADAVADHVRKWLQGGEAYDNYLGMNVCRYNC